jgi:uncharacterized protein (DUF433 family)
MAQPFPTHRIEARSDVMSGKPVIRGTRITVEMVLRRIADGYTVAELTEDWPHVTAEDIKAARDYPDISATVVTPAQAGAQITVQHGCR